MMIEARLSKLRIAPRKMRLLADLIRGKQAVKARALLDYNLKRGSLPLQKLLNSAIANAKNNFYLDEKDLRVAKIFVDEGTKLKRWRARAKGRANRIEKKTSSVVLTLESIGVQTKKISGQVNQNKGEEGKKIEKVKIKKASGFKPEQARNTKVKTKVTTSKTFQRKSI